MAEDKIYKIKIYHNDMSTSYVKTTKEYVNEFMRLLCDSQYDFTYAIGYTDEDILSFKKSNIRAVKTSEIGGVDE
ncbi:hypothetical protein [Anaerococcus sp. Marseille-Q5996]|uniref:hypothetical protein n=1 Tax=Anaerococcus sp. Marseille-Q5996 TaxID=2972769 RepID=UPI0021C8FB44|nr:hypothetical protein [Anaerococcus sp. Marseille-Q5996]